MVVSPAAKCFLIGKGASLAIITLKIIVGDLALVVSSNRINFIVNRQHLLLTRLVTNQRLLSDQPFLHGRSVSHTAKLSEGHLE